MKTTEETHEQINASWERERVAFHLRQSYHSVGFECLVAAVAVLIFVMLCFGIDCDWLCMSAGMMAIFSTFWWSWTLHDAVQIKRQLEQLEGGLR